MSQEYQCSGPSALALFECQIRDPFGDPLALLTMVFHRFYGARRVLYIVETSLISRIRIPLSLSLSLSLCHIIKNKEVAWNSRATLRILFPFWNEWHAVLKGSGAIR